MRLWAIIWQTLRSFSATEERSRTSFLGAGHIPWTTLPVPLSYGCKSPMKMHGTYSCGCASSAITSIGSKTRLQSQVAVVSQDVSILSQFLFLFRSCFFFCLTRVLHRFTHVQGTASVCIIETQFFDCWALCVMTELLSLHRVFSCFVSGGDSNRKRRSKRNLRIPSGGSGTYVGAARHHRVRSLSAYLKVRECMIERLWNKHIFGW